MRQAGVEQATWDLQPPAHLQTFPPGSRSPLSPPRLLRRARAAGSSWWPGPSQWLSWRQTSHSRHRPDSLPMPRGGDGLLTAPWGAPVCLSLPSKEIKITHKKWFKHFHQALVFYHIIQMFFEQTGTKKRTGIRLESRQPQAAVSGRQRTLQKVPAPSDSLGPRSSPTKPPVDELTAARAGSQAPSFSQRGLTPVTSGNRSHCFSLHSAVWGLRGLDPLRPPWASP